MQGCGNCYDPRGPLGRAGDGNGGVRMKGWGEGCPQQDLGKEHCRAKGTDTAKAPRGDLLSGVKGQRNE